jgi:hypothetical protein
MKKRTRKNGSRKVASPKTTEVGPLTDHSGKVSCSALVRVQVQPQLDREATYSGWLHSTLIADDGDVLGVVIDDAGGFDVHNVGRIKAVLYA